ncbi:MAG TPA: DUF998 domain-containing protein [Steroidobacteraceae bacterium]|nr:DUF998 domain-containing protein [Steroidobacteraceae bacterium]
MARSVSVIDRPSAAGEPLGVQPPSSGALRRGLLTCGVVAGPLFVGVALIEVVTVPGFDITRHPISVLELGTFGWIQIANFLVSGALFMAYAVGLRRTLRGQVGGTWGPPLLAICGLGTFLAGIFHIDPIDGFPPGTPAGMPTAFSTSAVMHNAVSTPAFLAVIAACFVLGRAFARFGQQRMAIGLWTAGVVFVITMAEALSGGPAGSLVLFVGVSCALVAVSVAAARLRVAILM